MERKSPYDMIPVSTAIKLCLENALPLAATCVGLSECCGYALAEDITAADPFPAFACSIMDGYAVRAPLEPGVYEVASRVWAGAGAGAAVTEGSVAYIATGAKVPPGANAVIQVEATEAVDSSSSSEEKAVRILKRVEVGASIRQIGCDIAQGELVLKRGQVLRPAEVGLLATVGVSSVPVFAKPVVGVMSTGNELVEVDQAPLGSQIRDSNRVSLLSAFRADGLPCVDLGVVRDVKAELEAALLRASELCDVVVTSGGVSMGEADFVKPLLQRLGTVHFGRLNMKPGKPTTFATLHAGGKRTLFFGLPGNPVSCLVTKALLIDPALRRLQGADSAQCMHAQAKVRLTSALRLDPERPEYHRAMVAVDEISGELVAVSTGSQASSRLLSLCSCNALLCLPQRGESGDLPAGSAVVALLTGPVAPPPPRACAHAQAALLDHALAPPLAGSSGSTPNANPARMLMRVGLLTVSDRASNGIYLDESGPEIERSLVAFSALPHKDWPVDSVIAVRAVVPDDVAAIQAKVREWVDGGLVDVLLTTGGTGFGARDFTPEAIGPLLERHAPALAQALVSEGLRHTPLASLSRPVAGTRGKAFICTFPGSVKGVRENIVALQRLLPRILELLLEGQCRH